MKLLRFSNSSCCNLTFWASDNYPDSYLDPDQWHGTRSPIEAWCQQFWPIFRHLQIFISHNCTKTLGWPSRVIETFWKVAMNSMHTCMIWSKELLNISQMKVVTLWELSVLCFLNHNWELFKLEHIQKKCKLVFLIWNEVLKHLSRTKKYCIVASERINAHVKYVF